MYIKQNRITQLKLSKIEHHTIYNEDYNTPGYTAVQLHELVCNLHYYYVYTVIGTTQ